MKRSWAAKHPIVSAALLGCIIVGVVIAWRFNLDMKAAHLRISVGSKVVSTPCGPIEYQEAGSGVPLLAVHGSGGGFDQGMAFAAPLAKRGIRVIAMSRFGYLRTPMPLDASARAQADAHVCLLDALGIKAAAIMGGSAGAPSALQMAIYHPDRVSALILLAPLAYKPPTQAISAKPMAPWVESIMMKVIASDFVFWAATHIARDALMNTVLATPAELLKTASAPEKARINAMMNNILPVSARAAGLRSDSAVGKALGPSPLEQVRAPTLIIAARDDGYGTFASAQYTADGIAGAKFLGFETGGHTWVGHNDEVMDAIAKVVFPAIDRLAR
jgi:2-hydroxy-6-oxonona-2,4-dienedioate hydrolase